MTIERKLQCAFLADERKAQTDEYQEILETRAQNLLLQKHELYVALFVKFKDSGEMVLKFSNNRPYPRKNDYLYGFTLPDHLRSYKTWGDRTFKDLIKQKTFATDLKCVSNYSNEDSRFVSVGFKGISREFKAYIENTPGAVVVIGPKAPPFEYLENLLRMSHSQHPKCREILDMDFSKRNTSISYIASEDDTAEIILRDLESKDNVLLQGPPGTGKTHRIADICKRVCKNKKTVLVTSFTNNALIEVAEKLKGSEVLNGGRVHKTMLSPDESNLLPQLQNAETLLPKEGEILLSTFYTISKLVASGSPDCQFDYVIVDEASQAFLAMLAAANMLGLKNIWIGDDNQMEPVVLISARRIEGQGYSDLIGGFSSIVNCAKYQTYQLTDTFRLGKRAAEFTGIFYDGTLHSKSKVTQFPGRSYDGPILVPLDLPVGDSTPKAAIRRAIEIAQDMFAYDKDLKVAILSQLRKTTIALQAAAAQIIGINNNLLIDTVARVQGITRDITIYVIPNNEFMVFSLERRLFNVATSRAKCNTYIICPKNITDYQFIDSSVREYLQKLQ